MIALLKKDLRLNAVPILGGILLVATPYLAVFVAALTMKSRPGEIPRDFQVASVMGAALAVAITAVVGGAAFALERRERSADFLALLPVTRDKILFSKLIIGVTFSAPLWLANLLAYRITIHKVPLGAQANIAGYFPFAFAAIWMFVAFGIAWFLSSFLHSPAIAACISIGIVIAAAFLAVYVPQFFSPAFIAGHSDLLVFAVILSPILIPTAVIFLAGTIYYLLRVEP